VDVEGQQLTHWWLLVDCCQMAEALKRSEFAAE
jgi:hypothetical protein